jgi:hypothetical protein
LKINFFITLPSTSISSKCFLARMFPLQTPVRPVSLSLTHYLPHPFHSSWSDHPNNIWWSAFLTTKHEVTGSIPGSNMGIFP